MRWIRFAFLILVAAILQAGAVGVIAVSAHNIKPDLLLILLVFFAIHSKTSDAIITSFAIGFAADIIIGSAMGPQIISFGVFGSALAHLRRIIAIKKMPYQAVVIFVTAVLVGTVTYLLSLLKGQPAVAQIHIIIFGTSLYSALVGPFLFLLASWLMRIKTHRFAKP